MRANPVVLLVAPVLFLAGVAHPSPRSRLDAVRGASAAELEVDSGDALSSAAPPGGGLLPLDLGAPADCDSTHAYALNNPQSPAAVQVTAFGLGCPASEGNRLLLWTAATGLVPLTPPPGALGGVPYSIADDGTIVGGTSGGIAHALVRPPGGPATTLPALPGSEYSIAEAIDATGRFALGYDGVGNDWDIVRWERVEGVWEIQNLEDQSGEGGPIAIAGDGTALSVSMVPYLEKSIQLQRPGEPPEVLPETGVFANDITQDGRAIAGFRWRACDNFPGCWYEVPTIWRRQGKAWIPEELVALDGVDSEAKSIVRIGGRLVVVGYGYTKRDAIMRAVAWVPDATGAFGAPLRLDAIGGLKNARAFAREVNRHGQVVGVSAKGIDDRAVLWTLPPLPHVFVDDFESGDVCGWSEASDPGACTSAME